MRRVYIAFGAGARIAPDHPTLDIRGRTSGRPVAGTRAVTREHKLALIVGFSILLLVGVLISDHYSRARQARMEPAGPEQVALKEPGRPAAAPVDPLRPVSGKPPAERPREVAAGPVPGAPTPAVNSGGPSLTDAIEIVQRITPPPYEAGLGGRTADDAAIRAESVARGGPLGPLPGGISELQLPSDRLTPVAKVDPSEPPKPARTDRVHTVQKNETLYGIAERYYGSGVLWQKLADYNKDRVGRDGLIRAGASLRIPSKDVLTGKPEDAGSPVAPPSGRPPAPAAIAADTRLARADTYVVKQGDTLGEISLQLLGTSRRWRDFLRVNDLKDEDMLIAGTVLKVPAR